MPRKHSPASRKLPAIRSSPTPLDSRPTPQKNIMVGRPALNSTEKPAQAVKTPP